MCINNNFIIRFASFRKSPDSGRICTAVQSRAQPPQQQRQVTGATADFEPSILLNQLHHQAGGGMLAGAGCHQVQAWRAPGWQCGERVSTPATVELAAHLNPPASLHRVPPELPAGRGSVLRGRALSPGRGCTCRTCITSTQSGRLGVPGPLRLIRTPFFHPAWGRGGGGRLLPTLHRAGAGGAEPSAGEWGA